MQERYELAMKVAKEAGALALKCLEELKGGSIRIESKGVLDFVTRADREVEQFIRQEIARYFPQDGLLGEELAPAQARSETIWVIDPIDGTANYIRDLDHWGVSIACLDKGRCEIGVIYDPVRDRLFHAARKRGAFLNGQRLPDARGVNDAPANPVMALGHSRRIPLSIYFDVISRLDEMQVDHRRCGSAAIALTQVAEGKVDGYFEGDLNPWDCLAGLLINQEIGVLIEQGGAMCQTLQNGPVLVAHPFLKEKIGPLAALCG
ncbi:inositol monophosphatase [uncultured Cohaesibacter sp.]|uniref:inositol monophosphatase family protein n=1 Tax=uncultured Cohaesibacter sp. TaxID=1002546 RepID=UPI0029C75B2A|nr:inositol monophosphatase [uncultured Cohaesibacter sp.]